jgi:predicted nucleotidyltransferase
MSVTPRDLARTLVRRAAVRREADERARAACLRASEASLRRLRDAVGFRRAWLVGSLAGGRFGLRSDIDVVLEGADDRALAEVAEAIGEATGRAVDVLAFERLPPGFKARVVAEGLSVS